MLTSVKGIIATRDIIPLPASFKQLCNNIKRIYSILIKWAFEVQLIRIRSKKLDFFLGWLKKLNCNIFTFNFIVCQDFFNLMQMFLKETSYLIGGINLSIKSVGKKIPDKIFFSSGN